ncbi:hypothetical protein [Streptococcus uberis]|nr:hypothetical protein [Streptococcus uberis]
MIKLLKKIIFAKEEHMKEWTIQNNGWEANANRYDELQKQLRGL